LAKTAENNFMTDEPGCATLPLDPYYYAIGTVASAWAEFEFSVNVAIWELANVSRMAGTCMTSQMIGPGPRFRCLVSLLHLRKVPCNLINAFNSLSAEAEKLGRQRNRYLHDPMVLNEEDNSVHRMEATADRIVKHDIVPVEIDHIKKLHTEIGDLTVRFANLYRLTLNETPPWPRTQFERSEGIRPRRSRPGNSPSMRDSQPPPSPV
jgi:hypothetical protein